MLRPSEPLTVLVVDDEPLVRRVLEAGLTCHGLRVLVATDGQAAVELYARGGVRIDVVLADVRMPGMDGPQTVAALRAVDPALRAVYMSGDTGAYAVGDLTRDGARFVRKPFGSLADLADILRRVAGG